MPRINIEDSIYKDNRFVKLVLRLGDLDVAVGALVRAWTVAQQFWVPNRKPIPRTVFDREGLKFHLVEVGLAEVVGDGIYLKGSEEQFAWLFQRVEAGRKNKGKKRKRPLTTDERPLTTVQRVETSSSSSFSNSKNKESIDGAEAPQTDLGLSLVVAKANHAIEKKKAAADEVRQKARQFCAAYVKAYQSKFTGRPDDLWDGKTQGQILQFVKTYPIERACELVQAYFQIEEKWFGTKGYDFQTFRSNLNRIGQALDSGHDLNDKSVDWQKVFGRSA